MKNYLGLKFIQAEEMTAKEAEQYLDRPINTMNADLFGNGYLVFYPDGYKSWSPKNTFERAYLEIGDTSKFELSR